MTRMPWADANQKYLTAALADVRRALERYAGIDAAPKTETVQLDDVAAGMSPPPALDVLCQTFDLSTFERNLLLLCAGVELDASFAAVCASAHNDAGNRSPTVSLAMAALPNAHWSAITPAGALRRWRLIEVGNGATLPTSVLRIDERVLHYLVGVEYLDERLQGFVQPLSSRDELVASHQSVVNQIVAAWSRSKNEPALPVIQLCGADVTGTRTIAAEACSVVGLDLFRMPAAAIPTAPQERETLLRLWEREAILRVGALLLDWDDMDDGNRSRDDAVVHFAETLRSPCLVAGPVRRHLPARPTITFDVNKPTATEQRKLWERSLGSAASALNGHLDQIIGHFDLTAPAIRAACTRAFPQPATPAATAGRQLWDACRLQARPQLDNLAQRIEPAATWDDLILPEQQHRTLRQIAIHVRNRHHVYETWGFGTKSSRGLGISALFDGGSGTGKTMAAEVLANELSLDLYQIDLSQVVSKYIGETEKNLGRVFDAAEESGAILLFDEADALFGKRSEVKDSHDRYANIEIGYLLQRMESYRGLAILTTNMKSALDTAFVRRLRFIVHFPFPDATHRTEIWRRIFPEETPTFELDVERLAQLNVTGGNIRNIAMQAAFLAADANERVMMHHLLQAARAEYAKLVKPLTDPEIRGWIDEHGMTQDE